MNVVVDTSVWSLALRRSPGDRSVDEEILVAEWKELIIEGRERLIGAIRQELLTGIKHHKQYIQLRDALREYTDEPIQVTDSETAAEAANLCQSRGIAASPVDSLICAVAMARGWSIFSTDPDFERYAGVLPIRLHELRRL